jgi:hypothetical protein
MSERTVYVQPTAAQKAREAVLKALDAEGLDYLVGDITITAETVTFHGKPEDAN